MALTPRQKRLCQAYMTSPTAKEAVIEAGYSSKGATVTATKLIKRPEVKEHIAKLEADAAERNNIDQDELVKRLRDNYDSAKDAKQYNACNRAVELEAKMGGLLKDKVHLMGLDVTSDADLIETLAKGDAKKATVLREILGPDTFALQVTEQVTALVRACHAGGAARLHSDAGLHEHGLPLTADEHGVQAQGEAVLIVQLRQVALPHEAGRCQGPRAAPCP